MKKQNYCGLFIIDENSKILLQFRGHNFKTFSNSWCTFGGKIENEKSEKEGIIREIKEELNLKINNPIKFYEYNYIKTKI